MILETRHSIPEILSRQPLFRILGGLELVRLAESAHEYRIGRNELLFQKGEAAVGMHLVVAGQIKLYLPSEAGAEKVVQMVGPGETFGEEAIFLNKPYPVAAEASKDSIVLVLDRGALVAMVDSNPALARAMMARLCLRFCNLVENMETCVQRSSAQRVVHYLTQQAPTAADRFEIRLDTNKQTIASQLNLAPETFSRVLGRLAKAGYIHVQGRCITVIDRQALTGYAAG
jgi:CRP-like cAMP-binding protein